MEVEFHHRMTCVLFLDHRERAFDRRPGEVAILPRETDFGLALANAVTEGPLDAIEVTDVEPAVVVEIDQLFRRVGLDGHFRLAERGVSKGLTGLNQRFERTPKAFVLRLVLKDEVLEADVVVPIDENHDAMG